jgi:hypothetical protein
MFLDEKSLMMIYVSISILLASTLTRTCCHGIVDLLSDFLLERENSYAIGRIN